jgi:hypothetical protein
LHPVSHKQIRGARSRRFDTDRDGDRDRDGERDGYANAATDGAAVEDPAPDISTDTTARGPPPEDSQITQSDKARGDSDASACTHFYARAQQ